MNMRWINIKCKRDYILDTRFNSLILKDCLILPSLVCIQLKPETLSTNQ